MFSSDFKTFGVNVNGEKYCVELYENTYSVTWAQFLSLLIIHFSIAVFFCGSATLYTTHVRSTVLTTVLCDPLLS
jgi:hypothetical protein